MQYGATSSLLTNGHDGSLATLVLTSDELEAHEDAAVDAPALHLQEMR